MSKQTINIGASPNDGTGTPLRTSFDYCNLNFTELYTATGPSGNNIVVPGNATITGDLTVDTSTLKVDSTNNRVGIGTATPAEKLTIDNTLGGAAVGFRVFAGDQSIARIAVQNTNGQNYHLVAGNPGVSNAGFALYDNTAAATRYYVDASGNLLVGTTTTIANGGVLQLKSGVTFPATQVASSDANTLDDYEEGTWSPTPSGSVNLTSVTAVSGRYTKVGRIVTLSGEVTATVTTANILTYFVLPSIPFANASTIPGSVIENTNVKAGVSLVQTSNFYAFFPAASAITAGSAQFFYQITYSV